MKMLEIRSDEPELMDVPGVDRKLLNKNLAELDTLNRYFGGHAVTLQGVKSLLDKKRRNYTIADLGCGSGDTMKYIASWSRKHKLKMRFIGVDKNIHAIKYLKKHCKGYPEISGMAMDYNEFLQSFPQVDIYLCSLFCHHLDNSRLRELFTLLKQARLGFVVNDLQRSRLAYYSAWAFTRLFNGSALSQNDGPVSVLRAFTRKELEQLLNEAGISNYSIEWKWAFRYRIIVRN